MTAAEKTEKLKRGKEEKGKKKKGGKRREKGQKGEKRKEGERGLLEKKMKHQVAVGIRIMDKKVTKSKASKKCIFQVYK